MLAHTGSGVAFDPLRPTVDVIRLEDIAHSLASLPRYLGHTVRPYSVAQHCVIVSHLVAPAHALKALLHDADEAYIGDMIAPLKTQASMGKFRALSALWLGVIFTAFGLSVEIPDELHDADTRIRVNEGRDLFRVVPDWARDGEPFPLRGKPIVAWSSDEAEAKFLYRFQALDQARLATH
jgi:hypothetical protein